MVVMKITYTMLITEICNLIEYMYLIMLNELAKVFRIKIKKVQPNLKYVIFINTIF